MKKITLLSTIILGATIFGATTQANAEEVSVNGQTGETPTTVTVKDASDVNGKDPLDPEDPNQTHLTLESVPAKYAFETAVSNKKYELNASLTDNNIVVFNDRSTRNWSVKASLAGNVIKRGEADSFEVTSFKVNDTEIAETAANGIVAKATITGDSTKDTQGNTGNISKPVTSVNIDFNDQTNTIKAGDTLSGTVTYQLYATMNVE